MCNSCTEGDDEARRKGQVLTLLAEQALHCQDFKAAYIHCQDLMAAGKTTLVDSNSVGIDPNEHYSAFLCPFFLFHISFISVLRFSWIFIIDYFVFGFLEMFVT